MRRTNRDRRQQYHTPKIHKAELSEKYFRLRLLAAVLFLLVGVTTLAVAFSGLVGKASGWQEISVASNSEVNLSNRFTLMYQLGASGVAAGAENRAVSSVYTEACIQAYRIFNSDESFADIGNLRDINENPGKPVQVSPTLYEALEQILAADARYLYLGPLYRRMENLCGCEADAEAKQFDPAYSAEYALEYDTVVGFVNHGDVVLELCGDNCVRLSLSEEYSRYAEENGITCFVDLAWMRNAFAADYIAGCLTEAGHTLGILSSDDGFTRCLSSEVACTFSVFDRENETVRLAATASAEGLSAIVALRDFPMTEGDRYGYYVYGDGEIRSLRLSPEDGRNHAAVPALIGAAAEDGCGRVLMAMLPAFMETDGTEAIRESLPEGLYHLYCRAHMIHSDIPGLVLSELFEKDGIVYARGEDLR